MVIFDFMRDLITPLWTAHGFEKVLNSPDSYFEESIIYIFGEEKEVKETVKHSKHLKLQWDFYRANYRSYKHIAAEIENGHNKEIYNSSLLSYIKKYLGLDSNLPNDKVLELLKDSFKRDVVCAK
jgi:hypothetical protein